MTVLHGLTGECGTDLLAVVGSLATGLFEAAQSIEGCDFVFQLYVIQSWRSLLVAAESGLVTEAAGMQQVPRDPYANQPIRMTTIDGQPVIYSVGPDGQDDNGLLEWEFQSPEMPSFAFRSTETNPDLLLARV